MLLAGRLLSPALALLAACQSIDAAHPAGGPLRLVVRPADGACAYVAPPGDTVIPFGRYPLATTARFDRLALVVKPGVGWVGINRQEQVLFKAYVFDNGPDYPAQGLLRVVNEAGLIDYADAATGRVVLPPRYEAAFPFANGRARVGSRCRRERRLRSAANGTTLTTRAARGQPTRAYSFA